MCWNKDVSLNTFLFSSFVLLLVWYNNNYTQYKVPGFENKWTYLFFISFFVMQLAEYFIWVNINNKFYNSLFTIIAAIILFLQPLASSLLMTNNKFRDLFIKIYLLLFIPYGLIKLYTYNFYSSVSPLGHLQWNFGKNIKNINNLFWVLWTFFFLFPLIYQKNFIVFLFGFFTLLLMLYNYYKDNSAGSMWCWIVNSCMLYYAIYLILYLPFYK
jgi:hypothetical protein